MIGIALDGASRRKENQSESGETSPPPAHTPPRSEQKKK